MEAKGCLQGTVAWAQAREFFYWRLQRRLAECRWVKRITAVLEETAAPASSSLVVGQELWRVAQKQLDSWVTSTSAGGADTLQSDQAWYKWYTANESKIEAQFAAFKGAKLLQRMQELISSHAGHSAEAGASTAAATEAATVGGIASLIEALTPEQKQQLKKIFA